ncbi:hypothetical protein ACFT4A_01745 [Streptomyces sp. NPDC057099]
MRVAGRSKSPGPCKVMDRLTDLTALRRQRQHVADGDGSTPYPAGTARR